MITITLNSSANPNQRIEAITLLHELANDRVKHSDSFRQRNLIWATVTFAGLMGFGTTLPDWPSQCIVSTTLSVLMVILCLWDRRWHRTKHGWDSTRKLCYQELVKIVNDPSQPAEFPRYDRAAQEEAEWTSFLPIVYYLLVAGAVASLFAFRFFPG